MTTFAEETQLANAAKQRRIQRESIGSSIAASERRLNDITREMRDKERAIGQLRDLEATAAKLPEQIAGKRAVIATGGFGTATIACIRTELLGVMAGTIGAQDARLAQLDQRRQAEEKQLVSLRAGLKEFES